MGELQQMRNKNDPPFRWTWLIANNSKNFANESESIKRNNLGLWKHSEIIYLI